jgi:hypothetical protein
MSSSAGSHQAPSMHLSVSIVWWIFPESKLARCMSSTLKGGLFQIQWSLFSRIHVMTDGASSLIQEKIKRINAQAPFH